jgi:hypothetical protein
LTERSGNVLAGDGKNSKPLGRANFHTAVRPDRCRRGASRQRNLHPPGKRWITDPESGERVRKEIPVRFNNWCWTDENGSLGVRRSRSSSQIIDQVQDFPKQFARYGQFGQISRPAL